MTPVIFGQIPEAQASRNGGIMLPASRAADWSARGAAFRSGGSDPSGGRLGRSSNWPGRPRSSSVAMCIARVPLAQPPIPPAPTGVDYLGLVLTAHDAETLGELAFRDLHVKRAERGQLA